MNRNFAGIVDSTCKSFPALSPINLSKTRRINWNPRTVTLSKTVEQKWNGED